MDGFLSAWVWGRMPPSTQTSSKDRSAGYLLLLLGRVAGRAADICGRARIIDARLIIYSSVLGSTGP